jgi:hypothetical protein
VALAGELQWDLHRKAVAAVVGYDCVLWDSRLRGSVGAEGGVSQHLERYIHPTTKLVLSAQLSRWNANLRYGVGLEVMGQ